MALHPLQSADGWFMVIHVPSRARLIWLHMASSSLRSEAGWPAETGGGDLGSGHGTHG